SVGAEPAVGSGLDLQAAHRARASPLPHHPVHAAGAYLERTDLVPVQARLPDRSSAQPAPARGRTFANARRRRVDLWRSGRDASHGRERAGRSMTRIVHSGRITAHATPRHAPTL